MMLSFFIDNQHVTSAHLLGYDPHADLHKNNDAMGSSSAPLLAHMLINTDTNIICILPNYSRNSQGRPRKTAVIPPAQWDRLDDHYAIMDVSLFADRLYRHMGWDRTLSYIIPALPALDDCVSDNHENENYEHTAEASGPLFFDLNAAISPDTTLFEITTPCAGKTLLEV